LEFGGGKLSFSWLDLSRSLRLSSIASVSAGLRTITVSLKNGEEIELETCPVLISKGPSPGGLGIGEALWPRYVTECEIAATVSAMQYNQAVADLITDVLPKGDPYRGAAGLN
jgi:hypothetical protein